MMTDTIQLAQQLIACPSITPFDAGCQKIIGERLARVGFQLESMRFGEVDNLWARYGHGSPLVLFAGHTDVVPTGPESEWSSHPFQPSLRDGYLYGRGAADMKGAIAAMVIAAEQFIHANPHFPGSIAFLITSDEEGPAINGTIKVMETLLKRGEKIDYCIIGEPSCDSNFGDQIRVGRRGSLHGTLIVHGKQGHVAHPHLALNPIHASTLALHKLTTTEWDQGNDDYPKTTFQITQIHSGTGALNVIPGHLDVAFNFRFSSAVTAEQLEERTEAILHTYGLNYDIAWRVSAEPFLSKKGKLITTTQNAIQEITSLSTRLSTGGGTSDGRFIAPTGVEVVELGTLGATAHQINECVKVNDLQSLTAIYQLILTKLL